MSCSRNEPGTCKSTPGKPKQINNVTIGIGPVEQDKSREGAVAIPLQVILNRRSESDTVVNVLSERHVNFTCEDITNSEEGATEVRDITPKSSIPTALREQEIEAKCPVEKTFSKHCEPTKCENNTQQTKPSKEVVEVDLEGNESEHKCTISTCQYWNKLGAEFGIPWEQLEINHEVDLTVPSKKSSEAENVIPPIVIEGYESAQKVGCCGGKKTESPPPPAPVLPEPNPPQKAERPKIDLLYDHTPCSVTEPYISAMLHEGDNDMPIGVCWEDTVLPSDVEISEVPVVEDVESFQVQESKLAEFTPCNLQPSKPEMPQRIQKKLNLKESVRFLERETVITGSSVIHPRIPSVFRISSTTPTASIRTLYAPYTCHEQKSVMIKPIEEKFSSFIASVDFDEEPVPLKSTLSKCKGAGTPKTTHFALQDTTMSFQDDTEINIEAISSEIIQTVETTRSLTMTQMTQSVTITENVCNAPCAIPGTQTETKSPCGQEPSNDSTGEVIFSHTIILTDKFELVVPGMENQEICNPCSTKTCQDKISPKKKVPCCAAEEPTALLATTPQSNYDICEPCKMLVRRVSSSSTNVRQDPVTLALMACEKELKPVRQALNKVRLKLRNMNMPELDCIFKNETDTNSYARRENTPASTRYSPPSYLGRPSSSVFQTDNFVSRTPSYQDNLCTCCCCYNYDNENKDIDKYNKRNVLLRMKIKPNSYPAPTTSKKSSVRFDNDNASRRSPSVSIVHRNQNLFTDANCAYKYDTSETDTDAASCSSTKKNRRKKKKSGKHDKCMSPHSTSSHGACPYLKALMAVLSIDVEKQSSKSNRVTCRKTQTPSFTPPKLRFRFKIK